MVRLTAEERSRVKFAYKKVQAEREQIEAKAAAKEMAELRSDLASLDAAIDRADKLLDPSEILRLSQEQHRRYIEMTRMLEAKSESLIPPSGYFVRIILPEEIAADYLANMEEVYSDQWVPRYGPKASKRLWFRNCLGMAVSYWFNVLMSAVERIRKVIG